MDVYEDTKELLKPITDKQKMLKELLMKTNTKRLNNFTKNRKAITSGLEDLPFFHELLETPTHTKDGKYPNIYKGFSREELNFLNRLNLLSPSVVFSEAL